MATIKIPFRAGNTSQNNSYKGIPGEITVDNQARTLRIHDGSMLGGEPLLRLSDLASVTALKNQVTDATLKLASGTNYIDAQVVIVKNAEANVQSNIVQIGINLVATQALLAQALAFQ